MLILGDVVRLTEKMISDIEMMAGATLPNKTSVKAINAFIDAHAVQYDDDTPETKLLKHLLMSNKIAVPVDYQLVTDQER